MRMVDIISFKEFGGKVMCKEHQLEGQKNKKLIVIAAILIAGFLISLIPIIIAAFYSHPTVVYPAPKTAAARGLNRTLAARGTAPAPPI